MAGPRRGVVVVVVVVVSVVVWLLCVVVFVVVVVVKGIVSFSDFLRMFFKVCWAPRCSFFRWAFCVRFCLCFLFFSGFFGFLTNTGRRGAEDCDSGLGAHYCGAKGL